MAAAGRPAEMDPDDLHESCARLRGHVDALELRLRKSGDGRRAVLHLIGDMNDQQALAQCDTPGREQEWADPAGSPATPA
jgi:hypothetical protein